MSRKKEAKLNVQALPRRDRDFMSCLVPAENHIFVSQDLAAAEPTIITHYTGDANYKRLTMDMVGQPPVWENGVLFIDDIYLAYMSVTAMGRPILENAWRQDWGGRSFANQWLVDPEIIKKALKRERGVFKAMALGLGYSMQAKKLRKVAFEAGFDISLSEAQECYDAYWKLFSGVAAFAEKLGYMANRQGYLVNEFGFRQGGIPERKAFNWFIQSTVNPVIILYTAALLKFAPYAKFVTLIHDELITEIPCEQQENFKEAAKLAERELNLSLKWSVPMRTGLVFGKNLFEAK